MPHTSFGRCVLLLCSTASRLGLPLLVFCFFFVAFFLFWSSSRSPAVRAPAVSGFLCFLPPGALGLGALLFLLSAPPPFFFFAFLVFPPLVCLAPPVSPALGFSWFWPRVPTALALFGLLSPDPFFFFFFPAPPPPGCLCFPCAACCCHVLCCVSCCGCPPCVVVGCCVLCDVLSGGLLSVVLRCAVLLVSAACCAASSVLFSCCVVRVVACCRALTCVAAWCAVFLVAVLRRFAFCSGVLLCARIFLLLCLVPLPAVLCPWALSIALRCCAFRRRVLSCLSALCAMCRVRFAVVWWCALLFAVVLCVSFGWHAVRPLSSPRCAVLCCALLVWCACVVLFVWSVLFLAPGAVVRCRLLCCVLPCSAVWCCAALLVAWSAVLLRAVLCPPVSCRVVARRLLYRCSVVLCWCTCVLPLCSALLLLFCGAVSCGAACGFCLFVARPRCPLVFPGGALWRWCPWLVWLVPRCWWWFVLVPCSPALCPVVLCVRLLLRCCALLPVLPGGLCLFALSTFSNHCNPVKKKFLSCKIEQNYKRRNTQASSKTRPCRRKLTCCPQVAMFCSFRC